MSTNEKPVPRKLFGKRVVCYLPRTKVAIVEGGEWYRRYADGRWCLPGQLPSIRREIAERLESLERERDRLRGEAWIMAWVIVRAREFVERLLRVRPGKRFAHLRFSGDRVGHLLNLLNPGYAERMRDGDKEGE